MFRNLVRLLCAVLLGLCLACAGPKRPVHAAFPHQVGADLVVAQISDSHLGLPRSSKDNTPIDAAGQLRRVVEMVNVRHPDLVIVSGDVGETPAAWQQARQILSGLQSPVYVIPGNHDVTAQNVDRWRAVFGPDYYKFQVRNVIFYMLDSQLLGNYDDFFSRNPQPLTGQGLAESRKMLDWLGREADQREHAADRDATIAIAVQHVPTSRGIDKVPDDKPYWITQEPYRSEEIYLLQRLGVRHMLVGHWHKAVVFDQHGFTHHVAPSTAWATSGPLGFAMHTISASGDVRTEFVPLE